MRATGVLLAFIVLLIAIVLGALSSTAGSRLIVSLAEDVLDPVLRVSGVSGSILADLCAEDVHYAAEGVQVRVEQVCVNPRLWRSVDFLKVDLASLRAESLEVLTEQQNDAEASGRLTACCFPVEIVVDELYLGRLAVNDLVAAPVEAVLALSNTDLVLESRFAYEGFPVELSTRGSWSALRLVVIAFGAEVEGEVNLHDERLPWEARITSETLDLATFIERPTRLALSRLQVRGISTAITSMRPAAFRMGWAAGRSA